MCSDTESKKTYPSPEVLSENKIILYTYPSPEVLSENKIPIRVLRFSQRTKKMKKHENYSPAVVFTGPFFEKISVKCSQKCSLFRKSARGAISVGLVCACVDIPMMLSILLTLYLYDVSSLRRALRSVHERRADS